MSGTRVATFPASHPYLEAVRPAQVRPAQVRPARVATTDTPWVPHPWWDPVELARQRAAVDLLHVHFGYDHLTAEQMRAWAGAVRRLRVPLVVTVHDLRNPHHDTADLHDAHLSELLAAADEVLTLTPGAARAIAERWGRRAQVVPHPGLVTPSPRLPRPTGRRVVGVHLKSLRRNLLEPDRVVAAVAAGARVAGGTLVVDVHPGAADRPELAGVRRQAAAGELQLHVHDRFTDAELVNYLQDIDVSVLPHRFGTHSGWLEACRDVGTGVVAPDCGFYAELWPAIHSYGNSEARGLDAGSLRRAVSSALTAPRPAPADSGLRAAERDVVRRRHAEVYRRALEAACLAGR